MRSDIKAKRLRLVTATQASVFIKVACRFRLLFSGQATSSNGFVVEEENSGNLRTVIHIDRHSERFRLAADIGFATPRCRPRNCLAFRAV